MISSAAPSALAAASRMSGERASTSAGQILSKKSRTYAVKRYVAKALTMRYGTHLRVEQSGCMFR